jgi:hypothetical protein
MPSVDRVSLAAVTGEAQSAQFFPNASTICPPYFSAFDWWLPLFFLDLYKESFFLASTAFSGGFSPLL